MLQKVVRVVNRIEDGLILVLVGVIVCSVFLQVFFRYVLQAPLSWTEELARSCLVWLTFVGSALTIRAKGHFTLEILISKLTGKIHVFWNLVLLGIMGVFLGVMVYTGVTMLPMLSLQLSASLEIPMSYIYLAIPIGSAFMLFHIFSSILGKVGKSLSGGLEKHD
jgi:TRAP-type C4-dicarboxylate transport system permease small subunit